MTTSVFLAKELILMAISTREPTDTSNSNMNSSFSLLPLYNASLTKWYNNFPIVQVRNLGPPFSIPSKHFWNMSMSLEVYHHNPN